MYVSLVSYLCAAISALIGFLVALLAGLDLCCIRVGGKHSLEGFEFPQHRAPGSIVEVLMHIPVSARTRFELGSPGWYP